MSKVFSVAAMALLVFVALGPATWQPRSGLGFELDHFAGYFVFTLMFCLAWPRPLAVGGALVVFALVLENLQSFLPDRSSYFVAALYSAAGVLAAALLAELFIRGRRRSESKGAEIALPRFALLGGTADVDQTHDKSLQRGRLGGAGICCAWSWKIDTPVGTRLGDGSLH
jgi:VanZ family protein